MNDPFALLAPPELNTMTDRAYREAARCWNEARRAHDPHLRRMLIENAQSAQDFWQRLKDAAR